MAVNTLFSIWIVRAWVLMGLLIGSGISMAADEASILIGHFSPPRIKSPLPDEWQSHGFSSIKRQTEYRLSPTAQGTVLLARSDRSASALVRSLDINPYDYPLLSWSWKPGGVFTKADLRKKSGDDSPARLYILFDEVGSKGWFKRSSRIKFPNEVICYVWANRLEKGRILDNAYTGRVKMVVVSAGYPTSGKWYHYKRNLVEDYRLLFGHSLSGKKVIGMAIMTDTDDTGDRIQTTYGNIILTATAP